MSVKKTDSLGYCLSYIVCTIKHAVDDNSSSCGDPVSQ